MKKVTSILFLILPLSLNAQIALQGSYDADSLTITVSIVTQDTIAGYQFAVTDNPDVFELTDVSGGISEEMGLTTFSSENMVISFGMTGQAIMPGSYTLCELDISEPSNSTIVTISDPVFSGPGGNSLDDVTTGDPFAVDCTNTDECGVCNGNNSDMDCEGICFGDAVEDCTGVCNGTAVVDCDGMCEGTAALDECAVCNGPGPDYECWDGSIECTITDCPTPPEEVSLSFGEIEGNLIPIMIESYVPIYGFQADLVEMPEAFDLVGISGGAAENSGWVMNYSDVGGYGIILAFSFTNTPVLPNDAILFNLMVGNESGTYATLTLENIIVADSSGAPIQSISFGESGFWGTMPDVPDAPTGLIVDNISGNSITLSWEASDLAEYYHVYRDGSLAASTGVTSFSDIDLEFDAAYTYYVTAVNIAGESAASASVDATTDDAPPPPAPTNLTATSGDGEVGLAWAAPEMPTALNEGFESTNMPEGWLSIDNDNDNDDWDEWTPGYEYAPHSGSYAIASASWSPSSGVPLNPDNWLISPSIDIVPGATLSYWVAAQDPSWSQEHIEVWVSTSGTNISDFDDEVDSYTCQAGSDAWVERMVDLNAYAGQSIHLAFRHTDVTDMFVIKLDDVTVTGAIGMAFNADFEDESDFSLFTHVSHPGYLPLRVEHPMTEEEEMNLIQRYLQNYPLHDDVPALDRMLVGYNIYRSETSGFGYVLLDGVGAEFTTYNDMSVTNGTTYYYVVTGDYDPEGESEYSNEVSATPSDFIVLSVNVLTPIVEIGETVDFEIGMTNDESIVHLLNFNLTIDPSSLDDVSISSTGRIPGSWVGLDPSIQGGVITISGHSDGTTGIVAGTGVVYTVSGVVSENATSPIVNLVFSNIMVGGENNSPLNIGEPVNGSFIIPGNLLPPEELEAQSGMDNQVQLTWEAPVTDYTPPECPDGSAEYVDCNGVCFNNEDCADGANYDGCIFGDSTWLGDGFCDDGTYGLWFWLDGNECPEYGNDCGDCGAFDPNVDDPYDMCSGGGGGGDDDCASLDEFSLDNTGDGQWDSNDDGCFDDTDFGGTLGMTSYFTFSWNADCDASGIYFGYNDVNESYISLSPPFTGPGPGLIYGFPSETGLVVMIESGSTLSDVESITTSSCNGFTASSPQVINFNFNSNDAQPSASDKVLSAHHTIIPDFDMNEYSNQDRDSRDVDITSFNLYRSDDNASTFSLHATTEETTTAYLDTDVTNGSEYFYFVTAMYNDELESPASNQVNAIPSTWVTLSLTDANILSGTTGTVEVSLSNEEQVIGFQVDFADTPDNLTIISATATERVPGDWAISTAEQTDGTGRLIAFSFNSTSIEPGEGAVFVVEFEASATEPTDVALCTSNEVINYLSNDGSIEEFPVNSGCSNVLADVEGIEMAMMGPGGSVDQGDTFEVSFSAYIPYPVTACDIILEDIPEAVTIVGITGGSFVPPSAILSVSDDGLAHINGIFFPPLNPGEGELFTVTFQVNDDAEDGEEVTIEVSDETLFSDDSGNAMYWRDVEPYAFSSGAYDADLVLTWSTQTSFKVNLRNPSAEIYGFEFHVLDDPDNISFVSAEATDLIPPQPMPWMVQSNENNDGEIVVLGFDMTGVAPIEPSNELSAIVVVNYEWVGDADSTEICFTFTEAVDQLAQLYYVNDMSCAMLYNTLSMGETKPVPTQFELVQNHPNPFNPATTINFSVPEERMLSVKVYDLSGRHVKTVLNSSRLHVGHHQVIWNGTDKSGNSSAAGIYIYTLESRDLFLSKKMILMK